MKKVQQLLSKGLDTKKRVGTFMYRNDNDNEWTVIDVALSPLLCARIDGKGRGKYDLNVGEEYFDNIFTAHTQSRDYAESPFRLTIFKPIKGSDIKVNAKLECVDESATSIKDILTGKIAAYENKWVHLSQWKRHVNQETSKMFSQITADIVLPSTRLIPVGTTVRKQTIKYQA